MSEDTMVAVDGSDALAFVLIRPGETEDTVAVEAAARGMSKAAAASVLRRVADRWESDRSEACERCGELPAAWCPECAGCACPDGRVESHEPGGSCPTAPPAGGAA